MKVDKEQINALLIQDGIYPAFHMNKKCWVSIIFADTLADTDIQRMISESYESL
ncbi:MAG: MmcQ/YjbR family DNA-binding protein [Clostridia bacterium]|nr:MmcQ/YjbR family DNA-binding protein [Clostridia bacterium]